MKKLLALMLILTLCLGMFAACDDKSCDCCCSNYFPATPVENEDSNVELTELGWLPVFNETENPYDAYTIYLKYPYDKRNESPDLFHLMQFNEHDAYSAFLEEKTSTNRIEGIDEHTFDENFVIAVYRGDDRRTTYNYSYSDFGLKTRGGKDFYSIKIEYTKYDVGLMYTEDVQPYTYDIVVVPRGDFDGNVVNIEIYVEQIIHKYSYKQEYLLDGSSIDNPR